MRDHFSDRPDIAREGLQGEAGLEGRGRHTGGRKGSALQPNAAAVNDTKMEHLFRESEKNLTRLGIS